MKTEPLPGYPKPPVVVNVSPAMATKWLEGNTHNRPVHQPTVEMYARDMKLNRWKLTHQGIAFDVSEQLVDGQHRLWAIIESGATVPMLVHQGLPMESQEAIDVGRVRALVDRLGLTDKFGVTTAREANVLKRLIRGAGGPVKLSCQDEKELFARHVAAIRFAVSAFPGRRPYVTRSEVYAVVARAYYNCDREAVKRFCYVLFSNEAKSNVETVPILLRDFLLASKGEKARASTVYLKTEAALRGFLDGKKLQRLYPATEEMFPLPEEKGRVRQYARKNPRNFDLIDRLMSTMRKVHKSTAVELARALGVKQQGQVKRSADECVKLGWLMSSTEKIGRHNVAVYTLKGKTA